MKIAARNPRPKFRFVRAYRSESGSAWRTYDDGQGRTCSVLLSSLGGRSFIRIRARRSVGRYFREVQCGQVTPRRREAAAAAEAERIRREEEWTARKAEWHRLSYLVGLGGSHLLAVEETGNGEAWHVDIKSTGKLNTQIGGPVIAARLAGELNTRRARVEVTTDPDWVYRITVLIRARDTWSGGGDPVAGDMYAVKIKEPGMKRWEFLGSGGHLTHLRVHAQMGPKARAEEIAARITAKYPDTQAKAVRL